MAYDLFTLWPIRSSSDSRLYVVFCSFLVIRDLIGNSPVLCNLRKNDPKIGDPDSTGKVNVLYIV